MKPETVQLFGTLEVLCRHDRLPLVWETEVQGEFSLWNFIISQGFVKETDAELVFKHWQNIERWGTPTDSTHYEYAPPRSERKNEDWNEAIAIQRQAIYERMQELFNTQFQEPQAYNLSVTQRNFEWEHPNFSVSILVGKMHEYWYCLSPIVPDQVSMYGRRAKQVSTPPHSIKKSTENAIIDSELVNKLTSLLNQLQPVQIYGYYHGGYNYSYTHRIVGAIGPSQDLAITHALEAAQMIVAEKMTIENASSIFNNQSISRFMSECLSDHTLYNLSFWDIGYSYEFGRTLVNDWIGIRSDSEFEYNP